jgi:predicted ATPase
MRIAISGTACQGKTTLITDFLEQWPSYTTPEKTYRDIIKENNLDHSSKTNKKTQKKILDFMIEEQKKYRKSDNVIFDRCPLDNLVYSMRATEQSDLDIDDKFVQECIPLVRDSYSNLDIIFFTPITKVAPVELTEDDLRDTDPKAIEEIDNIFKAMHRDYMTNDESVFFKKDDKPGIIEVFGDRRQRIEILKLYIDAEGDIHPGGDLIDEDMLSDIKALSGVWKDVDPTEQSHLRKAVEEQIKKDTSSRMNK